MQSILVWFSHFLLCKKTVTRCSQVFDSRYTTEKDLSNIKNFKLCRYLEPSEPHSRSCIISLNQEKSQLLIGIGKQLYTIACVVSKLYAFTSYVDPKRRCCIQHFNSLCPYNPSRCGQNNIGAHWVSFYRQKTQTFFNVFSHIVSNLQAWNIIRASRPK